VLNGTVVRLLAGFAFAGAFAASAIATDALPKSTERMLQDQKINPSIMAGIDKELTVPKEWMDGAKQEGTVKILGSWDVQQFGTMVAPFKERYPFIKLDYNRGDFNARAVRPLLALKEGRYLTDILTGFGGSTHFYQQIDGLEDLRELPGFKNPLPGTGDPNGTWVGSRLRYWCLSYNTNLVKKEELPKTWEDLLTNKNLSNGNLGVANRPQIWLLMLWGEHDQTWVDGYMDKFFTQLKPQLRKEGENALLTLLVAGEFHASLPSADYRTKQYHDKGAPIGWHCPEPVPLAVSQLGILKGNPHINASRVWVNWFLSKEGQIGQFVGDKATPLHKDLQTADFLAYPEELKGKKIAARTPDSQEDTEQLMNMWNDRWIKYGGSDPSKK
jgi:ABC-type Fe3+ transport system substrate-binding protein